MYYLTKKMKLIQALAGAAQLVTFFSDEYYD